jgi:hypothetical protein
VVIVLSVLRFTASNFSTLTIAFSNVPVEEHA